MNFNLTGAEHYAMEHIAESNPMDNLEIIRTICDYFPTSIGYLVIIDIAVWVTYIILQYLQYHDKLKKYNWIGYLAQMFGFMTIVLHAGLWVMILINVF